MGRLKQTTSMRLLFTLLVFCAFALAGHAQSTHGRVSQRLIETRRSGASFTSVDLFDAVPTAASNTALWSKALRNATILKYDRQAAEALIAAYPERITLSLPGPTGTIELDLQRTRVVANDFIVRRASDGQAVQGPAAAHYRGMIRGIPGSLVAISAFPEELMGMISDASGERVIGRFEEAPDDLHVLYHEQDLLGTSGAVCATEDRPRKEHDRHVQGGYMKTIRCVHWYWELAHDIFQNKGNVVNATNYATGLFNQSATLFDNDGIDVLLQEVYVWDVPSPYNATTSGGRLNQFGSVRTSFNGDLAHLLDYGGMGGVAWLSTLCAGTSVRMAYSGINSTFQNVPTYSWSVEVVTHEQGHNLGSRHTHACAWNGNNTAIDGCGPAAGYTEGACPQGPVPPSNIGGTIMSYCHLVSAGINFANGFGPQPTQVIMDEVNSSTCLAVCGSTCDPPGPLWVTALTPTSCTLNWGFMGATSYTLRWKAQTSGTWNTVPGLTGTTYPLTGLTQSTAYEFQLLSVCGTSSSAFSASSIFTTPAPCPDAMEPNNNLAAAANITLPTTINALIASTTDQDCYRFTLASAANVNLYLSNVAGDYDLFLLSNAGATLASSEAGGTSNESISYSAVAGTYVIRVIGWNGAFSASQCYALSASAYVACTPPDALQATAIAYNSATISWPIVQGATGYDLRWKTSAASVWTNVNNLTTTSYGMSGLVALTSYDVQVRTICAGGQISTSAYTDTLTFTTPAAPCEVAPPILIAMKVVLEGPYQPASGLMSDALREQSVLPLSEPYTAIGLPVTGATTTTTEVRAVTGNNAIVDWIVVELRNAATPSTVIERKAALVQRDGDVVGVNGTSALGFCSPAGSYKVAVRHRNHFGAMTLNAYTLGSIATTIDLTNGSVPTYGTNARKNVSGINMLWAGNVLFDNSLVYVGAGNDRDPILVRIGGTVPTASVNGYYAEDVNMNGQVLYVGSGNDRDPILVNIGGSVPTATLFQQLP